MRIYKQKANRLGTPVTITTYIMSHLYEPIAEDNDYDYVIADEELGAQQ